MADFTELLQKSLKKASPKLNDMWQDTAKNHGWNPNIARQTSVKVTSSGMRINYPSNLQQQVFNEEFGFKSAPKAAIRNFDSEAMKTVEKAVYDATSQFLTAKGII
jgi:threonine synthase